MKAKGFLSLFLALWSATLLFAQTGKIAGRITDAATGEGLPGVTVQIIETKQGNVSNPDGYYSVINLRPGTYTVRASFVGYATVTTQDVRVSISQTTPLDVKLREENTSAEVTVVATRPVVEADVSNSTANISSKEIGALPVTTIAGVVGLQAGVSGLSVRGSGTDQLSFNVNGLTMRDERDNSPITNISLSSIDEIQVQTGGFNAEYGNVRSGVVNVVTKEGNPQRFEFVGTYRLRPAAPKNFGPLANDPNSYWMRPYIDPTVAWTGTKNGAWDQPTQEQYPSFAGWISLSEQRLKDADPTNDMTPEALQKAFLWQHRKNLAINDPDYNLDFGFGGPVPLLNKMGRTRFFASFRRDQTMYMIPLNSDRFVSQSGHVKVTSDVGKGMKLSIEGMMGESTGTTASRSGQPGFFVSPGGIAGELSGVSFIDTRIFSSDYWSPSKVNTSMLGLTFNHVLTPNSFYKVTAFRTGSKYDTNPGVLRNETSAVTFGGVGFDEAPFGFQPKPTFGVEGMRTGVGMSNGRDSSQVVVYTLKGDYTNQLNRFVEVKAGLEYNMTDSKVNYATYDAYLPSSNNFSKWDKQPVRGAVYAQTKLEFKGMIANIGLRGDMSDPTGTWYVIEEDPFSKAFSAKYSSEIDAILQKEQVKKQFTLSPRVGVSFPVTSVSKLYFNYGHFRSMPDPNNLYLVRKYSETGQVARIASPNNPLPKTVAYELGFEQSLFKQLLVRIAGYYKDVTLQPYLVSYNSKNGEVSYSVSEPNSYEDIRGFEFTLERKRGVVQGFINYTYQVSSSGNFGYSTIYQNPVAMRNFINSDAARAAASSRPYPSPYARTNINVLSPDKWGPSIAGRNPLGGWRASVIGTWQRAPKYTWADGGSKPGVLRNVSGLTYYNADLRFSKSIVLGKRRAEFFADVTNALNTKRLSFNGFFNGTDQNAYFTSLHLPKSDDYVLNIPGTDRVGQYRKDGVAFVPMKRLEKFDATSTSVDKAVIYYENATGTYYQFANNTWGIADQAKIDQALKDKAYIDMPNQAFLTFLNPRDIQFGIRINF
jgi:hypothetical protein